MHFLEPGLGDVEGEIGVRGDSGPRPVAFRVGGADPGNVRVMASTMELHQFQTNK